MKEDYLRKTKVYGNHFWEFYNAQNKPVQAKIDWVIALVRTLRIVPEKYFKHLEGTNGIFEMRIKVGSNIYRIFCIFDEGQLVILLNGFQKKTQKTPKNELKKAIELQKQYYEDKRKGAID